MNSMAKALLLALPVLSATATAAERDLCEPKAYEMALRYQQKSAEIMALQLQTYRFATERFNEKVKDLKTPENYAVVMDLDETVLDNTPLLVRDTEQCHDYTKWDTWSDWEKQGKPGLIPGAKAFLDHVNQSNVRIYYVSDRMQENKADTLRTLKALGLPQVSDESVLLDTVSKEERRQSILKKQQIVMLFGDSLPDFAVQFKNKKPSEQQRELVEASKAHFGDDWIVLPNAAYGAWSKATLDSWNASLKKYYFTGRERHRPPYRPFGLLSIPFIGPIIIRQVLIILRRSKMSAFKGDSYAYREKTCSVHADFQFIAFLPCAAGVGTDASARC